MNNILQRYIYSIGFFYWDMGRHCRYRCFNVQRRYRKYFRDALQHSSIVSLLLQVRYLPLLTEDILVTHIMQRLVEILIHERIDTALCLRTHPWIIMPHLYSELLPPIYKNEMRFSTVFHIMTIDSVTYKIPAYFWCDSVLYTSHCPSHTERFTTKKIYKFI